MNDLQAGKLAAEAVNAFAADEKGWRFKWYRGLSQINDEISEIGSLPADEKRAVELLIRSTAIAFRDANIGALNPIMDFPKNANRPKLDSIGRAHRCAIAMTAGMFLSLGKHQALPAEDSYRRAAIALNRHGANLTWRQVRAAWSNRHRYFGLERWMIEFVVGRFDPTSIDPLSKANGMAREAAMILNSKVPMF